MGGCICNRAASYSPHVHEYSCKIYKLKLNMQLDFEKKRYFFLFPIIIFSFFSYFDF